MGGNREKGIRIKYKRRIGIAFMLIAFFMAALVFRVAWIQVVKADEYTDRAVNQQVSDIPLEARRGGILDVNGKELATSARVYSVWIRPGEMRKVYKDEGKRQEISEKLAVILNTSSKSVRKKIESKQLILQMARYLNKDKRDRVKALGLQGVELVEGSKRYYPLGTSGAKLLGSVNDDGEGRTGLEKQFDGYLSGVAGRWMQETDLEGNSLSYGRKKYFQAKDGYNLMLTIDEVIQHYCDEAMEKALTKTKADKIMCIAMNPKTGDILAMETLPSFNPNNAAEPASKAEKKAYNKLNDKKKGAYLSKMWRNPVVSDLYEPGSTFKLLTTGAALEEGVVTPASRFYCSGHVTINGIRVNCWDHSGHGSETLDEAVGNSCNPAMIEMGRRVGKKKYYQYLQMFGITQKTNVDLPAESSAIVRTPAQTDALTLGTMSFGQGVAVTPVQLLTAICSFGNGGILMKPRIVKKLTDSDGKTVKTFKTQKTRKVVSAKTASEVSDAMEYDVTDGGGSAAYIPGYRVGGKTGTAEKASAKGGYSNNYCASFVGMAPMDDPQIAVLVVIDTPRKGRYGGSIAAPVAKEILKNSLAYYGVTPKYTNAEKDKKGGAVTYVPGVSGKNYSKAVQLLQKQGLKCKVIGKGSMNFKVKDQYPKAGKKVKKGTVVYLYRK